MLLDAYLLIKCDYKSQRGALQGFQNTVFKTGW